MHDLSPSSSHRNNLSMTSAHNNLDDKLALINAFVESALCLSFNEAAKTLLITPSSLSRRIKRLEESLGSQLFVRTTRRMALTEAGEIYLPYAQRVLADIKEGDNALASLNGKPSGVLKVNVPSAFGRICIAPFIPEFLKRFPQVQLDIHYTDTHIDLISQRVDVAVRIGKPLDSTLRQRQLAINERFLVASPTYLNDQTSIHGPEDLINHSCLHFSHLEGANYWQLKQDGSQRLTAQNHESIESQEALRVPINPVLMANDAQSLYEAAVAGTGVALLADFLVHDALKKGLLVKVLPQWKIANTQICAVYPDTAHLAPKTRAFIDYLVELFEPVPVWQRN